MMNGFKNFALGALVVACATQLKAEDLRIVADFNSPAPNNVEGNFGAFSPSETEQVYVCMESLDDVVKRGEAGSSMRLVYNVGKGGAFNGFWMKLGPADSGNNFDASQYKKLSFWIRGDDKAGTPNKFKVELKGDPGSPVAKKYVGDIGKDWKKVEIGLDEFSSQGVDLSKLNELVVVFEQRAVSPATTGAVYIDDVSFEK
jgi:hypothetical protein